MSIELVIDNRERKLIAELTDNIEFTTEDLSIGDILFREGGETVLIIERKTVQDLKASITDGRAREQKARLLGSGTQVERIMYLIEGNLEEFWSLGKVNTLEDYAQLSGLDYKNKKVLDEKKAFESEFFLSRELNKKPF